MKNLFKEDFPYVSKVRDELNRFPEKDRVELKRPGGKTGLVILTKHYELLCVFILRTLEANGEISLTDLLEAADENLNQKFSGEILWIVINVKHDLEARSLIKIKYLNRCVQLISLNRSQSRNIRIFLKNLEREVSVRDSISQVI